MSSYYLSPAKDAAEAAEAAIFAAWRERIRAIDPEAVDDETGTIIGRNAATGELEPDAGRTTGYFGAPAPAVQGFYHPVPEDEDLQLADPGDVGVEVTVHLNPWPAPGPDGAPQELPEWRPVTGAHDVYPVGMLVRHEGWTYRSRMRGNDQEPQYPSLFWEAIPEPEAPEYIRPTGYQNVYPKGAIVIYNGQKWESLIAANNEVPGADATNRYWRPVEASGESIVWAQPMPGGNRPYVLGEVVYHNEKVWRCAIPMSVWEPGTDRSGWEEVAS